jgi:hypothetical protein
MIATLRHRLIRVPARLVRHAGALTLRLPPGYHLLAEVLTRIRAYPQRPAPRRPGPDQLPEPRYPRRHSGARAASNPKIETQQDHSAAGRSSACYSRIRV